MPEISLMTDAKPLLRSEMKRRRAGLATAQPLAGDTLALAVQTALDTSYAWPQRSAIIAGYWPIQSEINPFALMQIFEDRGYRLALPCLIEREDGHNMVFRRYVIGDAMVDGPFDIRQPADNAQIVDPDVVLVPLLAFDGGGRRLGYGGGFYDRALGDLRARCLITAWGMAFCGQQLAEIPVEVHDQPLDAVLTEQGVVAARS